MFRDDRPIRSRFILGKPEGVCINPPPVSAMVKLRGREKTSPEIQGNPYLILKSPPIWPFIFMEGSKFTCLQKKNKKQLPIILTTVYISQLSISFPS